MIEPHGGLLVDRTVPAEARPDALARAGRLRRVAADRDQVLDAEKIGNGTLSPLTGFMGSADLASVVDRMRLTNGLPWTIPILFLVDPADLPSPEPGEEIAIADAAAGTIVATLRISEVFGCDKPAVAAKVYGTADPRHPGVARFFGRGDVALAGEVTVIAPSPPSVPARFDLSPAEVRRRIAERGFRTVAGFQTRNLGHRAHEHLQKTALELCDGLLIQPLIGWKKPGDMLPDVILEGYEVLIDRYFRKERVLLASLSTAMRYAGPREAVFHAIIRKNFGCTHFIVGRDHAGVGSYYQKYDSHRIFDAFDDGSLGVTPLRLHGPFYCRVCGECTTEKVCPHPESARLEISGTNIRAMLAQGVRPPVEIIRPEIGDFLLARARSGPIFFEDRPAVLDRAARE